MPRHDTDRARFALDRVRSVEGDAQRDKYKTELLKLPARLHTSGLGQTLAYHLAGGGGSPKARIADWLGEWLLDEQEGTSRDGAALITRITREGAEAYYRRSSAEARALAPWLKRFAEAFLAGGGGATGAAGGASPGQGATASGEPA